MLKITCTSLKSQSLQKCGAETLHAEQCGKPDCDVPLSNFFDSAVEQNEVYYASRQGTHRYTSPLFKLVQCLKAHPQLATCTAVEAFARLNSELKPDWGKLFPAVTLPSLEFITAWEQINIPAGASVLAIIEPRVINEPLTLLHSAICEGYEKYLGIAFHLQCLTPRRDILLPVGPLSGLLTKLLSKSVSQQSVSNYCRQAKKDGYITLTANAHHPSGKAAQYHFALNRFTEAGVELSPENIGVNHDFSHGSQGKHGINGIQGIEGIKASSSSCVLKHAIGHEEYLDKNNEQENMKEQINTDKQEVIKKESPSTILQSVKPKKKKSKTKRQSVVAVWQSFMHSKFGWQPKLPDDDYGKLVRFGRRTDEFGQLILTWVLDHWDTFASAAVGPGVEYPSFPSVAFFYAYEALAFNLWTHAELSPEEGAALMKAAETCTKEWSELEWRYSLGEEVLFQNVAEQLKYQGLLVDVPKGWEVCGQTFATMSYITDKYYKDEKFRHMLCEAAGVKITPPDTDAKTPSS